MLFGHCGLKWLLSCMFPCSYFTNIKSGWTNSHFQIFATRYTIQFQLLLNQHCLNESSFNCVQHLRQLGFRLQGLRLFHCTTIRMFDVVTLLNQLTNDKFSLDALRLNFTVACGALLLQATIFEKKNRKIQENRRNIQESHRKIIGKYRNIKGKYRKQIGNIQFFLF